jgi:(S)-ureidoglycine aminohydrolase
MKMASILIIILFLPAICFSQLPAIASKKYSWITPTEPSQANLMSSVIFEGAAHDMEFLQMSANAFASKEGIAMQVPDNEEHLLLVKSGTIKIKITDRAQSIGPGSIALLTPGERYHIQETGDASGTFYLMKYRSKKPVNKTAATKEVSFVKNWDEVVFKPHDRGGIRNFFEMTTPMSKRFEMHVTTLKEGIKSHEPHTHRAEEIVLVIENKTEMQIGDQFYKGGSGDIYYLGSNVPHAIQNVGTGTCTYFAYQFE